MKNIPKTKFPNSSVLDIVTMLAPAEVDQDKMNPAGMFAALMNPNSLLKGERKNDVFQIIGERGDEFILYELERR